MKHTLRAALAFCTTLAFAVADNAPTCSESSPCPADAPCCSQYGQCGVGAYCLGGCDPKASFNLQSCVAAPTCKSADLKLNSLDDIAANTVYLGYAHNVNWVSSGNPAAYNGEAVLLTMAPSTVGTLLTSTHYVWYGKISATLSTSEGQGVVTAFILMSDMKDEIDFEFVGDDVTSAQSNYYFQGITDYHNMIPLNTTDTRQNKHTYTVDWTPDTLTWSIDGNAMRTVKKSDTWNSTTNAYHYPQTPSRVQLSLWPAGLSTNGEGTVTWAGGLVDWTSPYMQNGYYYAVVSDVSIECYDPPTGFSNNFGTDSYYYTSAVGTNDTVAIGNNDTTLASFYATGNNPKFDPDAKASGTTTSSKTATATPATVPGISGGGNAASSGENPATGQGSGRSGNNPISGSNSGAGSGSGFQQNAPGSNGESGASKLFAGSAVALLGFFVAALVL